MEPAPEYSAAEIRQIRHDLSVSQQVFADILNASASAVRAWEQGTREPDGPTRRLLQVAVEHPEVLLAFVQDPRPRPYESYAGYGVMVAAEEPVIPYDAPRRKSSRK